MDVAKEEKKTTTLRLDTVGTFVSFVCAVHCFLTPLLIVIFPVAIARYLGNSNAHDWLVISAVCLALVSLVVGHRKHKNYNIFILPVISSVLFYFTSHDNQSWSNSLILATAGLILVVTHLLNKRLCDKCDHCKHEDSCH
jgi:hypothetical protein